LNPFSIARCCQKHKNPQKQRLKEMSKFNFQIRNKTRLYDSKISTQKHKTKTRCAKPMWKWFFILFTYANMNMKIT
jgi:hypothetical protein